MNGLLWAAAILLLIELASWALALYVMYAEPNGEYWGAVGALASIVLPFLNLAALIVLVAGLLIGTVV